MLDAGDHEIDEGLRGIDDAVGVGDLDAKALEESLIDGVQELLLLVEIGDGGGGVFDGEVEGIELGEIVAAEGAGGEGLDDLLDLLGDDVALHEIGDVEDVAKDALGQEMLDEHLLDGVVGEVGVQRAAAEGAEVLKGGDEFRVGVALGVDEFLTSWYRPGRPENVPGRSPSPNAAGRPKQIAHVADPPPATSRWSPG